MAAELGVDEAILDGEVIAPDTTGRPQFYKLLRRAGAASYVAFDLLWLNGTDLRPLPLSERRQRLLSILPNGSAAISAALSVHGRGLELFELMRDHDLEGIRRQAPGRSLRATHEVAQDQEPGLLAT